MTTSFETPGDHAVRILASDIIGLYIRDGHVPGDYREQFSGALAHILARELHTAPPDQAERTVFRKLADFCRLNHIDISACNDEIEYLVVDFGDEYRRTRESTGNPHVVNFSRQIVERLMERIKLLVTAGDLVSPSDEQYNAFYRMLLEQCSEIATRDDGTRRDDATIEGEITSAVNAGLRGLLRASNPERFNDDHDLSVFISAQKFMAVEKDAKLQKFTAAAIIHQFARAITGTEFITPATDAPVVPPDSFAGLLQQKIGDALKEAFMPRRLEVGAIHVVKQAKDAFASRYAPLLVDALPSCIWADNQGSTLNDVQAKEVSAAIFKFYEGDDNREFREAIPRNLNHHIMEITRAVRGAYEEFCNEKAEGWVGKHGTRSGGREIGE